MSADLSDAEREALRAEDRCPICGDSEPHHIHLDGQRRIEDYFVVGRGQEEMEAVREWHVRATRAEERERLLRAALENITVAPGFLVARELAQEALAVSLGRPEGGQ